MNNESKIIEALTQAGYITRQSKFDSSKINIDLNEKTIGYIDRINNFRYYAYGQDKEETAKVRQVIKLVKS